MFSLFQDFVLSQWLILIAYFVVFLGVSRWAVVVVKDYPGYGLGWFLAVFVVIVYGSIGGVTGAPDANANQYLNGFQVLLSTFMGLIVGSVILVGLRFGMDNARAVSLQIALYTALILILMFLVVVEGGVAQRMIGIFGMAIGIATLFALVLFPSPQREQEINMRSGGTQGNPPVNVGQGGGSLNAQAGGSRLDEIRNRMNEQHQRR